VFESAATIKHIIVLGTRRGPVLDSFRWLRARLRESSFAGLQVAFRVPIECDDGMIGHRQFQTGFKFSAEDLPVRLSATIS